MCGRALEKRWKKGAAKIYRSVSPPCCLSCWCVPVHNIGSQDTPGQPEGFGAREQHPSLHSNLKPPHTATASEAAGQVPALPVLVQSWTSGE